MWRSYLALGDSVSEGVGDSLEGMACRGWAELVAEALGVRMPGLEYRNIARKGATGEIVLADQVPVAEAAAPDFVTITVGANDSRLDGWSPDDFAVTFDAILERLTASGATILTGTYPDIRPAVERAGRGIPDVWRPIFDRLHEVDEVIRDVSVRRGVLVLDLEPTELGADPRYLSRDLAHPNALGHHETARLAVALLSKALQIPGLELAWSPASDPSSLSKNRE